MIGSVHPKEIIGQVNLAKQRKQERNAESQEGSKAVIHSFGDETGICILKGGKNPFPVINNEG